MRSGRTRSRAIVALALVVTAFALLSGSAATARSHGHHIALGVYVYSADHPRRLPRYSRMVGRAPLIVSSYKAWLLPPFPLDEMEAVWNHGALPLVTWEPRTYTGQPISLRSIDAGRYNRYVHRAARTAAAWGRPIFLRFAHEMNGDWFPWGRGRGGNSPRIYRRAWRHLVRIFRAEGADNVKWVWAPNVNNGSYPFGQFYPGDDWVDWVGLDGFNWGKDGEWRSFTEIFGTSYEALGRLTTRPVIVAETGSSESGGDKSAWTSSALRREIPRFSRIAAVVWFSEPFEGVDTRVNSSASSLRAFRRAIAAPRYGVTRREFLSTPSSSTQSSKAPASPSGGFGKPSFVYRLLQKLHGRNLVYAIVLALAFLLALAVLGLSAAKLLRRRTARRAAASRSTGALKRSH
jgi:Glycosyl hydrolase family 26